MAFYCTSTQMTDRYGADLLEQLTDRATPRVGAVVSAVLDRAIADASAEIDGYLLGRYALPLADVPPALANIAMAIAIYKLHRRSADEKVREDYDDALKRLKEIHQGVFKLDVAGVEPAGSSVSDAPEFSGPERVLTGGRMDGLI